MTAHRLTLPGVPPTHTTENAWLRGEAPPAAEPAAAVEVDDQAGDDEITTPDLDRLNADGRRTYGSADGGARGTGVRPPVSMNDYLRGEVGPPENPFRLRFDQR